MFHNKVLFVVAFNVGRQTFRPKVLNFIVQ